MHGVVESCLHICCYVFLFWCGAADDKERRKDPNWKPAVAAGANKGGKSVTGFADVGVDLNAGGG